MAELDAFEARFAAACRRYLDEAPTEVDAAEVARTVMALSPDRRLPWPATLRGAPALAWLLLLAILLAALATGVLFVGSQLQAKLPAVVPPVLPTYVCPPGSTPDEPGPVDQARPVGYGQVAFDRRAGKLIVVTNTGRGSETWTFDVCTNTWARMHPNREPSDFAWRPLVYDVDSDLTIGVADGLDGAPPGRVWAYDLGDDTWTEKAAPTDRTLRAYDPLSGLVLATNDLLGGTGQTERWTYDVATDTWTLVDRATGPAWHGVIAYDASVNRFVVYAEPGTWLFDIGTRTWSKAGAETPAVESNWAVPTITYDESAERTVVRGSSGMAAYDATADRWEVLVGPGEALTGPTVYDPVNRRLLMFDSGIGDVVAFDLVAREWTVLLEPVEE